MKNLNSSCGIFKTLCFGFIAILTSTFTGCDDDIIHEDIIYGESYRFEIDGTEYKHYNIFDSSERTFTVSLYQDLLNEPIYNFSTCGVSKWFGEYKEGKIMDELCPPRTSEILKRYANQPVIPDFIDDMPVRHPEPGVEYHPLDWVTVKNIQNPGDPVRFQLTISENNTDEMRGFCMVVNGEKKEDSKIVSFGRLFVFQLPAGQKTSDVNMKIRYRGKIFESSAQIDQDGCYSYDNPEFAQMIEKLSTDPNIDMIIMDDEIVDYYDIDNPNYLEFLSSLDRPVDPNINFGLRKDWPLTTRANGFDAWTTSTGPGYFAMYDNDNFNGKGINRTLASLGMAYTIRNLKELGMNDNITSLAVGYAGTDKNVCSVLTVWEDADFNYGDDNIPRKKHRISIIASYNNPRVSRTNLKNIKKLNASGSWNDCISAISCHFGYLDRTLLDY